MSDRARFLTPGLFVAAVAWWTLARGCNGADKRAVVGAVAPARKADPGKRAARPPTATAPLFIEGVDWDGRAYECVACEPTSFSVRGSALRITCRCVAPGAPPGRGESL